MATVSAREDTLEISDASRLLIVPHSHCGLHIYLAVTEKFAHAHIVVLIIGHVAYLLHSKGFGVAFASCPAICFAYGHF